MYQIGSIEDRFLTEEEGGFQIWQIGKKNSQKFTDIAIKNYMQQGWVKAGDVSKMYIEDAKYAKSGVFLGIKHPKLKQIIGTLRLTLKTEETFFIIEDHFGVNIKDLCNKLQLKPTQIWHAGRIVINKDDLVNIGFKKNFSLKLFWALFRHFYNVTSSYEDNLVIGENHEKTQRYFSMLGIPMNILGQKEYYPSCNVCAVYCEVSEIKNIFQSKFFQMEQRRMTILESINENIS